MPAIVGTSITGYGSNAITETTLNGSDTLTYKRNAILILSNPTGGALSPTIDGDGGTTISVQGLGVVNVAAGYAVGSIGAGDVVAIQLNSINEYLRGTIAVTSGTGLVATLLEP